MRARRYPIFLALGLAAAYASLFGFVSTDSWNYLAIAWSLRQGGPCAIGGEYAAVFPCGYPAVLAVLGWSDDVPDMILCSKLANLALWLSTVRLLLEFTKSWPATLIFAVNPISLHIMLFTWSENMMMLAVAGALFAIKRLADRPDAQLAGAGLLAFFLILGCAARYIFGPFAAVIALAIVPSYGWRVFAKALPAFALAAAFYAGYQYFNILHTGFGTGMPRLPAPEPTSVLIGQFGVFAARQVVPFAMLLAVLAAVAAAIARANPFQWRPAPAAALLVCSGIGYLLLAFALRARFLFDPYGPRTVGPGIVLFASGLACSLFRAGIADRWRVTIPATAIVFAFAMSGTPGFKPIAAKAYGALVKGREPIPSLRAALAAHRVRNIPGDAVAVVSFGIDQFPPPMLVTPNPDLYYPPTLKRIAAPAADPNVRIEGAAEFQARLDLSGGTIGCYFDFTAFPTDDRLKNHLAREYAGDIAARLAAVARPAAFVPCAEFRDAAAARR